MPSARLSLWMGTAAILVVLFSGCSVMGDAGEDLVQIGVAEIQAPERAAPGASVTFTLTGFATDASLRVERRTPEGAELTAWAPEAQPDWWCATSPLPRIGRFQAQMHAAGAYVLRVLQPDSTVLEKRVTAVR